MKVFPRELHAQYHISDLPGQFMLSTDTAQIPDGWRTCSLGRWILASHATLQFFEMHAGGTSVGWLLGYPIDPDGNLVTSKVIIDEGATNPITPEQFETFLYGFGGRYAAVLLSGVTARVYLDPCGSLAVVYCPSQKLVASTPSLIPYGPDIRDDDELITTLGIPDSAEMFPLGLTAKVGVERLLPNHYLDLDEWRSVRHWPAGPIQDVRDVQDAVARIATQVRRNIGALASRSPHLALTAGQDSRMLLACAREFADVLTCFTVWTGNLASQVDCEVAHRLCRRFGLKHVLLRFQDPRSYEAGEWLFRTGFSLGIQSNWRGASAVRQLHPQRVDLSGHVGELARANYWGTADPSSEEVTPARLTAICGFPLDSTTEPRFQEWLAGLSFLEPDRILDFFYLEQRLGCWAGIMPYGAAEDGQFHVFPLCHRGIIELMLALPCRYRWDGSLLIDIIRREWPDLLEYPINTPAGIHRAWVAVERMKTGASRNVARLMKAARNPAWFVRKVIERIRANTASRQ